MQDRRKVVGIGQAKYYRADPQPKARNLLGVLLKKMWTSLQGSGAAEEYINYDVCIAHIHEGILQNSYIHK